MICVPSNPMNITTMHFNVYILNEGNEFATNGTLGDNMRDFGKVKYFHVWPLGKCI